MSSLYQDINASEKTFVLQGSKTCSPSGTIKYELSDVKCRGIFSSLSSKDFKLCIKRYKIAQHKNIHLILSSKITMYSTCCNLDWKCGNYMNLLLMIKDHENILVADNDMSFKYTHIFNAI